MVQVDGRQWIKGQPSAGLAAKARTIYGAKHEEFIDSVKAAKSTVYSVWDRLGSGARLSVNCPYSGKIG